MRFSPHTRGCSEVKDLLRDQLVVFPAYAGMFLSSPGTPQPVSSFPRIRGDVPILAHNQTSITPFSPHTRGCSPEARTHVLQPQVFPAYAGMFPHHMAGHSEPHGFPRIRGDVPAGTRIVVHSQLFSPHTRGCSCVTPSNKEFSAVFPAYAGMFPTGPHAGFETSRFPRIRGDVPEPRRIAHDQRPFSPHTRGCSFGVNSKAGQG